MEEEIKKRDRLMIFTFGSLALALVSSIACMIYVLINRASLVNRVVSIVGVLMLVGFAVMLVITGFYIENKKAKIGIAIASWILAIFSIFQIFTGISKPKDLVLDFTDYDIKDVVSWAKERKIEIIQEYAYSDKIEEYHVIKQDVEEGTPVKDIDKITVTVSNGVDPTKKADVTNMVGWKLDDVIKFIDDNHLTNVTINFEFSSTVDKDVIISQDVIKEIRRNEPVTLVSSLGREADLKDVTLDNLVGLDEFHALIYLNRNYLKYKIVYNYSDGKEGIVLKQSIRKWTVITPGKHDEIVITISKKDLVTVPDLKSMTQTEINEWATNNRIKVDFIQDYDDYIKMGKVISVSHSEGSEIETGTIINVIISKGQIKMPEFTNLNDFREWADENEINYTVEYEYSDTVAAGKLISSSHSKGQTIKNSDTVSLVISNGGNTSIPDLIGLSKSEAKNKCDNANIACDFTGNGNKVTKQSMLSGSTVPSGTSITLTLGE